MARSMNLNAAAGLSGMLKEGQKHFEGAPLRACGVLIAGL